MATNNSNSLFPISHHAKLVSMHEIDKKSEQMFVSPDDKEQHVLIGQLLLALEIDSG